MKKIYLVKILVEVVTSKDAETAIEIAKKACKDTDKIKFKMFEYAGLYNK